MLTSLVEMIMMLYIQEFYKILPLLLMMMMMMLMMMMMMILMMFDHDIAWKMTSLLYIQYMDGKFQQIKIKSPY